MPAWLRHQLNEKIRNGVPGKELVGWLNEMPEVQAVLRRQFDGKEITEQNLSAWRQGGYADWLANYERRLWLEQLQEESEDLQRDAGPQPLMETFGTMMEMILGQAVQEMLGSRLDLTSPPDMKQLLELSREVARHRRLSQAMMKERELKLHRKKQLRVALGPDDWDLVDEWEDEDLVKMYGSDEEEEEEEGADEEADEEMEEDDDAAEEDEEVVEDEADPGESSQIAADFLKEAEPGDARDVTPAPVVEAGAEKTRIERWRERRMRALSEVESKARRDLCALPQDGDLPG
jgi:hypothetical protein